MLYSGVMLDDVLGTHASTLFAAFGRIRILRRPKLSGAGTHDGLQLPDTRVIDITNDKGVQVRSHDDFAQGREVTVVREIDPRLHGQVMVNVYNAIANPPPYRLADSNCEVFVHTLVCEKPESPSANAWTIFILVLGGLALLAAATRA